jgi:hypothetical protein
LFVKYIIAVLIPDVPGNIRKQMAKQDYLKDEAYRELKREHVKEHHHHEN